MTVLEKMKWFEEFIWEVFLSFLGIAGCMIALGAGIGIAIGIMLYCIQWIAG